MAPTANTARSAYNDTAAWAALCVAHPHHADTIHAVARGAATSNALPAEIAAEIIDLCDTANDIYRFTHSDTRDTVTAAARARHQELGEPRRLDELRCAIRDGDLVNHPHLADRIDELDDATRDQLYLDAFNGPAPAVAAIVNCCISLIHDRRHRAPLPADGTGDPDTRARIITASALFRPDLSGIAGLSADDLRHASRHLHTPATNGTSAVVHVLADRQGAIRARDAVASAHHAIADAIWTHPDTSDDDLCAHWGIDTLADADATQLEPLADHWSASRTIDPARVDTLLEAVTRHGTRPVPCPEAIPYTSSRIAYPVAVAVSHHDHPAGELYTALVDGTHPHWTDDDIATWTPAGHPVRDQLLEAITRDADDHTTTAATPAALLDDAMRSHSLGAWLTDNPDPIIAARLTTAADAADFDIDAWTLLWDRYRTFVGTPEELIDVLDVVRPGTTAA